MAQREAPPTADYVVVGAGSAGSVLTRRLLDAGHSVHVLEAGPADTEPNIHSPQGWPLLLQGPLDWAVMTTPQRHAENRRIFWPRGRVLGGSSALNGMIYIRGHPTDYDHWATHGAPGWSWNEVLPLFLRSENHIDGTSTFHGAGGLLPVERITHPHPLAQAFVEAATHLGYRETTDFNAEVMDGVGFNHTTTDQGQRASAWQSFTAPMLGHPRLTVTTEASVQRLHVDSGRAVAVDYTCRGTRHHARAHAEIILAAGTIGSPTILLHSGIGPPSHLTDLNVPVTADLPGVGENLHDHLLVGNIYETATPPAVGQHNLLESQLYTHSQHTTDTAPDLQPLFLHLPYPTDGGPAPEHGYTIAPGLVRPRSRGTLRLASSDPATPPLVDPNILADGYDLEALTDAIELCRDLGADPAFAPFRTTEHTPPEELHTREQARNFARQHAGTYHHQVGTCKMGTDDHAVVDPQLRVHGLAGLRIADASIIPTIPSGNTNAPTIMIGEKAADLLLNIQN